MPASYYFFCSTRSSCYSYIASLTSSSVSLAHRDTTPGNGRTSVVIREAIDLTRNNRIDLESLKSLRQVESKYL